MSERPRRLAGEKSPTPQQNAVPRRLAGDNVVSLPLQPVQPLQPAAQTVSTATTTLGPLGDPAVVGKTASRGLKIIAARKRNLYDNRPPLVGMRTVFNVDFYDLETRQPVSPTQARVLVDDGTGEQAISLVENSGRIGHYSGSFIPDSHGNWVAKLVFGGTNELLEVKKFYVL